MNDNRDLGLTTQRVTRTIGDTEIILETTGFAARSPIGGFVWNRPAAVRVGGHGGGSRLPIRDVTRRWQLALYGIGLLFMVAGLWAGGRSRKE